MAPFSAIPLSPELRGIDWVSEPQQFSEQLTAYLWSQNQIDRYHEAAQGYQQYLQKILAEKTVATPRWTMVTVGQGIQQTVFPLFRRLLPHGTLFTNVDPSDGLEVLLTEIRSRAQQYPLEYGHWYIEGGEPHAGSKGVEGLTVMSYARLVPAAKREFGC
jgi:hypothetical protein